MVDRADQGRELLAARSAVIPARPHRRTPERSNLLALAAERACRAVRPADRLEMLAGGFLVSEDRVEQVGGHFLNSLGRLYSLPDMFSQVTNCPSASCRRTT